jgi:hypothetical protein
LAEVKVIQFDAIGFVHSSPDTLGQVRQTLQELSRFAIGTESGILRKNGIDAQNR